MSSKTIPLAVPAAAMLLLDFIGDYEAPGGYNVIYGNNQGKLPKPLTEMTLGDVIDAQPSWTKRFKSSAAGRYQFMRNTLQGISQEVRTLRGDVLFNKGLQDRLGFYLLLRRGYQDFIDGRIGVAEFGKRLAQEWASFPVLQDCQGNSRAVARGQSYYAGDGLNKALVAPDLVERTLRRVLTKAAAAPVARPDPVAEQEDQIWSPQTPAKPEASSSAAPAKPKAVRKSGRFWTWLTTGGVSLTTIAEKVGLFQLDWRVQISILLVVVGFAVYAIATMPAVRNVLGLAPK
ncbi:hypothetical protein ACIQUB_07295 [Rhizobium sp. NPDC090275]|uniref:hypothetical protein n=1 Tax=Rhizobium sp. NPDC090275 TaxID=3364498 RepID=UPI00383BC2F7